jgi:hypothetical protein
MSDKAIDVRVAAGVADRQGASHTTETRVAIDIPRGPGALRTTILIALVTFAESSTQ